VAPSGHSVEQLLFSKLKLLFTKKHELSRQQADVMPNGTKNLGSRSTALACRHYCNTGSIHHHNKHSLQLDFVQKSH